MWMTLIFVLLTVCTDVSSGNNVSIAFFNLNVYGTLKASRSDVMDVLAKVISRYDIACLQEIKDSSETKIYDLLNLANELPGSNFSMTIGPRVGRTSQKEQYAVFYRKDSGLEILGNYTYNDADDDFERPPYCVHFASNNTVLEEFGIATIHTKPTDAENEVTHLPLVFDDMKEEFDITNVMVGGDLNGDCSYVTQSEYADMADGIRNYTVYKWWIDDNDDTLTQYKDCAYDRIITEGTGWVNSTHGVDRFDEDTDVLPTPRNCAVFFGASDHYPVYLKLK